MPVGRRGPLELEQQNASLRREADLILYRQGLASMTQRVGEIFVGGSYFFDLMVWRDLDIYIRAPEVTLDDFFDLGARITKHFDAWKAFFTNNRDADSPGLYWGIRLGDHRKAAWKLDIWAIDDAAFDQRIQHAQAFVDRLTPKTRAAILEIKQHYCNDPRYRDTITSASIYQAVLDHGVTTPAQFQAHLVT